jgi:selenocysteine lyase/cysteine desulfurase
MNVAGVLGDEDVRRREFPVARDRVFLAHAGVCPLPTRVARAISDYLVRAADGDQEAGLPESAIIHTREMAARLLGCHREEIALVGPTSLGLSFIASGLPLQRGDNVLFYLDDYPSNVYPWMALAERGAEVRPLKVSALGRITLEDVLDQVDSRTRLVALASCHFMAGWRIDVQGIGAALRERNILFCVDAIQTVGAFPTPVAHVDFLAADAHKWMLGPCAAGLLYVRKSLQEQLRPPIHGWHNMRCPNFIAQPQLIPRSDARRYEVGTQNVLGLAGLQAALELLLEVGVEHIAAELLRKRRWLVPALQARGWQVLQAEAPPEHASAIVSIHRPEGSLAGLHQRLIAAGIVTSLREDRAGRQYLRLSPHFYNTDAEVQRVVELL